MGICKHLVRTRDTMINAIEQLTKTLIEEENRSQEVVQLYWTDITAVFGGFLLSHMAIDDLHLLFKIWLHYAGAVWDCKERQTFIAKQAVVALQLPDFQKHGEPLIPWGGTPKNSGQVISMNAWRLKCAN